MNIDQTKTVVRHVVSWCVGSTVISLINQNVYSEKKLRKAEHFVGATALSMMITDHVGSYTDKWIDDITSIVNKKEDAPSVFVVR